VSKSPLISIPQKETVRRTCFRPQPAVLEAKDIDHETEDRVQCRGEEYGRYDRGRNPRKRKEGNNEFTALKFTATRR
jgi:hypothetical protein